MLTISPPKREHHLPRAQLLAFQAQIQCGTQQHTRLGADSRVGEVFARHDFVEASWALITPLHEAWAREPVHELPAYEAGEWGPSEADALIERDGRRWRTL